MSRSAPRTVADEIAALQEGGGEAVQRFTREHGAAVLSWCIRLSGPEVDPAELARQVLDDALRGLHKAPEARPIRAELLQRTVAAVRASEGRGGWFRRRKAPVAAASQGRRQVQEALQALSLDDRVALVLVDLDGLRLQVAAGLLEVPVGELAARVGTARRVFAESARAAGLTRERATEGRR